MLLDQLATAAFFVASHGLITFVGFVLVIRQLLKGTCVTWIRFQREMKSLASGSGVQTEKTKTQIEVIIKYLAVGVLFDHRLDFSRERRYPLLPCSDELLLPLKNLWLVEL